MSQNRSDGDLHHTQREQPPVLSPLLGLKQPDPGEVCQQVRTGQHALLQRRLAIGARDVQLDASDDKRTEPQHVRP